MADLSDVVQALVTQVAIGLYPNGTGAPSTLNKPVKVFGGWPGQAALESDLKVGSVQVSVYPRPEERNTSTMQRGYTPLPRAEPGVVAAVSDNVVTFSGFPIPGDMVGLTLRGLPLVATLNSTWVLDVVQTYGDTPTTPLSPSYAYVVQAGDTPTSIATAFAVLIAGSIQTGPSLRVPNHQVDVNVAQSGSALVELKRQEKLFQVTVWANCYSSRDVAAAAVDVILADVYRLALPDGTEARTRYSHSVNDDGFQKSGVYRRDLFYFAEWATTKTKAFPATVAPALTLAAQPLTL